MHFRRGRRGSGNTVQSFVGPRGGIWRGTRDRYADFGSRVHGHGSGGRDDGAAAGGRYHVRGFFDADDGSDGESGGEGALHVRGDLESADGAADDARSDTALGGAAFAIAARVAQPRAGIESGDAVDAL